jgi:prepilin-type N-terminal cleavage/methylation domain-containing protein
MARRRIISRGFTLAELMAVVVIVAILSTLAIVAYRALLRSARGTEATQVVGSIRLAQEKYKQETDNINYADVSVSLSWSANRTAGLYPTGATPSNRKVGWGAPCGAACVSGKDWNLLAVQTDGPVLFGYTTKAYTAANAAAAINSVVIDGVGISTGGTVTQNAYVVTAVGNPDGQGEPTPANTDYCTVASTSLSNQIFMEASCK